MNHAVFRIGVLILLLTPSCQRRQADRVLARVGDTDLTLEEALSQIDTSQRSFNDQLGSYVTHWVNEEIIYQEARKNGIDREDDVQRRTRNARRQLIVQTFLQQNIDNDTAGINQSVLDDYFKKHASEFFVHDDVIKLNLVTFSTRERAGAFAASVSRGIPWGSAIDETLRDTTSIRSITAQITGRFFSQHTLFPIELWKVAAALGVNEVSFPVKGVTGYSIIQPLEVIQRGHPATFELVLDEVRQHVFVERRRRAYNDLLGTLRARYGVEILSSTGSPDTGKYPGHE